MPTLLPRITITLTHEGHHALKRLSAAGGGSQSSIVADLLQMSAPTLERLAAVLELAKQAQVSSRESLKADLAESQEAMEAHLGIVTGEFDRLMAALGEKAPQTDAAHAPAGESAGAAPASTPFSNRGVTPPHKGARRPSQAGGGKS